MVPPMADYVSVKIEARNEALRRVGEIEDYRELTAELRFNAVSTFELTLDADSPAVPLLSDTGGIIVTRDGRTLLSGPITRLRRMRKGNTATLTVTGVSDDVALAERLALPVPEGPPYTASAYDDKTGAAETVLRYFVDRNLGGSAVTARRLPYLVLLADQGRGGTVRGRGRFHRLLDLLQPLALAGGDLGFRLVQVGNTIEFQVYQPADRSGTAVFSLELGNLLGYDYATARPSANYVYVGGAGEGTARAIVEGGDAASIGRHRARVEAFRDRRDTDDPATLTQTRDETLAERAAQTALSISPIDTEAVAFGRDYDLGDRVTVVIDGEVIQDVVREVVLTLTREGADVIEPVVGTPGASNPKVPALFDRQRRQAQQISNLERR
jgi:hypothetical protein